MREGNRGTAGGVDMKQLVAAASGTASILTCRLHSQIDACPAAFSVRPCPPRWLGMVTCFQGCDHHVPLGCSPFPLDCVPLHPSRGASCCLPHALLPQSLGPQRASLRCASVPQSLPGAA